MIQILHMYPHVLSSHQSQFYGESHDTTESDQYPGSRLLGEKVWLSQLWLGAHPWRSWSDIRVLQQQHGPRNLVLWAGVGDQFSEKRENEWKTVCGEGVRGKRDVWVVSSCQSKRKPNQTQLAQGLRVKVRCRRQQRSSSGQDHTDQARKGFFRATTAKEGALFAILGQSVSSLCYSNLFSAPPEPLSFPKKCMSLHSSCLKISIASGAYKINFSVVHETL